MLSLLPGNDAEGNEHDQSKTHPKAKEDVFTQGHDTETNQTRDQQHRLYNEL